MHITHCTLHMANLEKVSYTINENTNTMHFKISARSQVQDYLYLSRNCTKIIIVQNDTFLDDAELKLPKNICFIECSNGSTCNITFGKNIKYLDLTPLYQNFELPKYVLFVRTTFLQTNIHINFPKSITCLDLKNGRRAFVDNLSKNIKYVSYGISCTQQIIILPKHIQCVSLRQDFNVRYKKGSHSQFWVGYINKHVIFPPSTKIISLGHTFTTNIILPESVEIFNTSCFSNVLDNLPNRVKELHCCEKTDNLHNLHNLPKSKKSFRCCFYKK